MSYNLPGDQVNGRGQTARMALGGVIREGRSEEDIVLEERGGVGGLLRDTVKRANTQLPGSVPFVFSALEDLDLLRKTEILGVRGRSPTLLADILRIPDQLLVFVHRFLEQPDVLKKTEMFLMAGMRHMYRGFRQHGFLGVRQFLHPFRSRALFSHVWLQVRPSVFFLSSPYHKINSPFVCSYLHLHSNF